MINLNLKTGIELQKKLYRKDCRRETNRKTTNIYMHTYKIYNIFCIKMFPSK